MHKISRAQIYLIILVALILQAGPLNSLKIFGAKPDLMLTSVIFFGLFLGSGPGLESGIVAGILKDIFALDLLFANTLTLGLTGLIVGLAGNKFFKESSRTEFLVVLFFTAFSMSLHYLVILIFSKSLAIRYPEFLLCTVIPACLYTGLISIPLYKIFIYVYNLKEADDYL